MMSIGRLLILRLLIRRGCQIHCPYRWLVDYLQTLTSLEPTPQQIPGRSRCGGERGDGPPPGGGPAIRLCLLGSLGVGPSGLWRHGAVVLQEARAGSRFACGCDARSTDTTTRRESGHAVQTQILAPSPPPTYRRSSRHGGRNPCCGSRGASTPGASAGVSRSNACVCDRQGIR